MGDLGSRKAMGKRYFYHCQSHCQIFITPSEQVEDGRRRCNMRVPLFRALKAYAAASLLSDTTLRCDATAALQRAEDSYETVYYGRIFPSSIKAKLRWTAMVSTSDDKKESG